MVSVIGPKGAIRDRPLSGGAIYIGWQTWSWLASPSARRIVQMRRPRDGTVSRLWHSVKLAEHFVHGVDDRLWLLQLNLVT